MIITIKGADFSKSNIGQLDSWTIFATLGAGASYSGPNSVKKGASLTFSIILSEGYSLGSSGITITMGNIVQSLSPSVSDKEYTYNIGSVTGNVKITVSTVNDQTGETNTPVTREYTIGTSLKLNDMEEVAPTKISGQYYKAGDDGKLVIETRSGYKGWKGIRIYANQKYQLNADTRAVVFYRDDDTVITNYNLKDKKTNGVLDVMYENCWLSVAMVTSVSDDDCTITRIE